MKLLTACLVALGLHSSIVPVDIANSALNDYNISFDATEHVMVFARSEADFRNAQIYVSERVGDEWSRPALIGFSDDNYADSDPWLTPDGRTLYFISDRPAEGREPSRSDYDVWRSFRSAGGWSPPEHLGTQVNSRGQELGPELHDGVLYFSSARRRGLGGLDIFRARLTGETFEEAVLLDGPFNTVSSDSDFTLSADGRMAMFWRSTGETGLIHLSYREEGKWTPPVALPASINVGPFNFTPSFSSDSLRIRYASTLQRPNQPAGLADIYEAHLPPR